VKVREIPDPGRLATQLDGITGVVDHGLFVAVTDVILVADKLGTVTEFRK
jgi:ribose 5-phosphate isomerase